METTSSSEDLVGSGASASAPNAVEEPIKFSSAANGLLSAPFVERACAEAASESLVVRPENHGPWRRPYAAHTTNKRRLALQDAYVPRCRRCRIPIRGFRVLSCRIRPALVLPTPYCALILSTNKPKLSILYFMFCIPLAGIP